MPREAKASDAHMTQLVHESDLLKDILPDSSDAFLSGVVVGIKIAQAHEGVAGLVLGATLALDPFATSCADRIVRGYASVHDVIHDDPPAPRSQLS